MKRVYKMLFLILLTGSIPLLSAFGQEKKNEQKIKVVIADESGTKTVIDTTFTGKSLPDSIKLKNGKVIYIGLPDKDIKPSGGTEKILVTVTSDEDGKKTKEEKIIIMSSDSVKWTAASTGDKEHVYVYSTAKSSGSKPEKRVVITSAGDNKVGFEGENIIIVKDGKTIKSDGGKSFSVYVTCDENDSDTNVTRYVIAKDGLVVTVEGKNESKAKELIKEIESKLDIKSEQEGNKEVVKTETKKTVKK